MTDRWGRPDVARRAPRSLEAEEAHRLQLAREALKGIPTFDRMNPDMQASVAGDTADVVAVIVARYGGRFRRTGPDVSWSALNQGYSSKTADSYAFGRFRKALDNSSRVVYKTLFAMLEAGVDTREALAQIGKPSPDLLEGMSSLLPMRDSARKVGDGNLSEPPLPDEVAELGEIGGE